MILTIYYYFHFTYLVSIYLFICKIVSYFVFVDIILKYFVLLAFLIHGFTSFEFRLPILIIQRKQNIVYLFQCSSVYFKVNTIKARVKFVNELNS